MAENADFFQKPEVYNNSLAQKVEGSPIIDQEHNENNDFIQLQKLVTPFSTPISKPSIELSPTIVKCNESARKDLAKSLSQNRSKALKINKENIEKSKLSKLDSLKNRLNPGEKLTCCDTRVGYFLFLSRNKIIFTFNY